MTAEQIVAALQARVDAQLGRELSTPISCTPGELQTVLALARQAMPKATP